jgi:hypothetical protein
VLFGEHVRQDPALSSSSFAEIAKETGKRWGALSHEERVNAWEKPAADRLQDYKEELERYKQTDSYRSYQTYLEEFKQQQHKPEPTISTDDKASSTSESASFVQQPALMGQEEYETIRQEGVDTEDLLSFDHLSWESRSQGTIPFVNSGLEEVRQISTNLGVNRHLIRVTAFPPEDVTTNAVKAFLHGTGSLLYLWDHDEALDLVRSVYHPESNSTSADATEIFAMSTVGVYCDGEANTISVQEKFLHFFLYMLSSSSNTCDLRRMRLFACLAICRFTNSVESARRLICKRLMFFEVSFNGLTARSIRPKYWKADI